MTYTLVLLRHGESDWNAKNLFTGWVDVPLSDKGRAEAEVIQKHSLAGAENMTYAELGAKITAAKNAKNDADVKKYTDMRATAQQGSFLRASLFTSVLSYGVCAFAMGMGLMLGLVGWSLTKVAGALETVPVNAKA